jgi:phosphoglycolate phosphatase-like HAD superfamily hydrolase
MTDDEREKFDAIRMNLELTGHDLESRRERMESMRERMELLAAASEEQRKSIESHERENQSHERKFDDVREDIRRLAEGGAALLVVSQSHERRIMRLEGQV